MPNLLSANSCRDCMFSGVGMYLPSCADVAVETNINDANSSVFKVFAVNFIDVQFFIIIDTKIEEGYENNKYFLRLDSVMLILCVYIMEVYGN